MLIDRPRLVVAGTQSGVGKTSITTGLAAALKRRGLKVQTFKAGPDFLDPTYLKIASGRTCYNLDAWMMGRDYVERLFAKATLDADIAVIEGVMGLFDGFGPETSEGSTAQIAEWLQAPVVLVADAGGVSRSFAAMVKGFVEFERGVTVAGVVANNAGSASHTDMLASSLASAGVAGFMGGVRKGALPKLRGRRLGLVSADYERLTLDAVKMLADAVEVSVSLDDALEMARSAPPLNVAKPQEVPVANKRGRLGVAMDRTFHFYYPDSLEALERGGLELVYFSPVDDSALPADLDAVYIGGGYPEIYAEELSANSGMLSDIRRFADSGLPVYGECGGLMYLSKGVEDLDGRRYPLAGLLPVWARMRKRFKALGYVEASLNESAIWGETGSTVRGHTFHYSELDGNPADHPGWKTVYTVTKKRTGEMFSEGYSKGRTLVSYAHLHFASRPAACESFIEHCVGVKSV